jgi:hypothetical protein
MMTDSLWNIAGITVWILGSGAGYDTIGQLIFRTMPLGIHHQLLALHHGTNTSNQFSVSLKSLHEELWR